MDGKRKTQEEYVDYQFGFPVVLRNVEMVKVRDFWCPRINQNTLRDLVLLALVTKKGHLTGYQAKFVRRWLGNTLESFGKELGVSHSTVKKWENKGDESTGTAVANDFYIRCMIIEKMLENDSPLLRKEAVELPQLSPTLGAIPDILVFAETDNMGPFGLSVNFRPIINEMISSAPPIPTSTSFDFGSVPAFASGA